LHEAERTWGAGGEGDVELGVLLIAAGFVFSGWVFLLRSHRSGAALGKPVTLGSGDPPVASHVGHPQLKLVLLLVLAFVTLALVLAALVVGAGMRVRPACTTGVIITEGPYGEKIECVCVGGVQAWCFEPGP
jgi:hypothetical protein